MTDSPDARGPVERALDTSLESVTVTPGREVLVASARTLARALDAGAGLSTAAVARELRATIGALTADDGIDDGLAELVAELSSPARHGKDA